MRGGLWDETGVRFGGAFAGGGAGSSGPTCGGSTFTRGFVAVARDAVDGSQVRVAVVVTSEGMVDLIGAGALADVADAAMVAEDSGALCVPFLREADAAGAAFPGHSHLSKGLTRRNPGLGEGIRVAGVSSVGSFR